MCLPNKIEYKNGRVQHAPTIKLLFIEKNQ